MATSSDVLVISFIGYSSKEIKVGNQKVLSVTLSDDAEQLDEVVVTAFGTGQKKETVTGFYPVCTSGRFESTDC